MRSIRGVTIVSVAVATSIAIGLGTFELSARLIFGVPAVHLLTADVRDIQTDFDVTYGLKADRTRVTCPVSGPIQRRIAVIGDSFAFGQGVRDGEDFVGRISCQMRGADILNLGVIGQDFSYYDIAMRSLVPSDVDDIILLVYENDLPTADSESPLWKLKRLLYNWSHLVLMLRKAKQRLTQRAHGAQIESYTMATRLNNPKAVASSNPAFFIDVASPSPNRLELFDQALERFIRTSRRVSPKARVFAAFAPEASTVSMQHRQFYRSLADLPLPKYGEPSLLYRRTQLLCKQVPHCSFIDLFPALMRHGDALYFPHDFHWNAEGHRVVAEVIMAALTGG